MRNYEQTVPLDKYKSGTWRSRRRTFVARMSMFLANKTVRIKFNVSGENESETYYALFLRNNTYTLGKDDDDRNLNAGLSYEIGDGLSDILVLNFFNEKLKWITKELKINDIFELEYETISMTEYINMVKKFK